MKRSLSIASGCGNPLLTSTSPLYSRPAAAPPLATTCTAIPPPPRLARAFIPTPASNKGKAPPFRTLPSLNKKQAAEFAALVAEHDRALQRTKQLQEQEAQRARDELDRRASLLSTWRAQLADATTSTDVEQLLDLAREIRPGLEVLGRKDALALVEKTVQIGMPELALHALFTRRRGGLVYDHWMLASLFHAMLRKLETGSREALLQSVKLPGAPLHKVDRLLPKARGRGPSTRSEPTPDVELPRAQLSLLEQMMEIVETYATLRDGIHSLDMLATLVATYIRTCGLIHTSTYTDRTLANIVGRCDELAQHLTLALHAALPRPQRLLRLLGAPDHSAWEERLLVILRFTSQRLGGTSYGQDHVDPAVTFYRFIRTLAPGSGANGFVLQGERILQQTHLTRESDWVRPEFK